MARKSKRSSSYTAKTPKSEGSYSVAVYLRLSVEERLYKNGTDSLQNQRELIYNYLKDKPDMRVFDVYCDNGETGTSFERGEFQRMMYDVYNGRVNCVIVKDLSRFGREYIEAGDYLERIFPLAGVRFIAVNDNADNKLKPYDISIPIKNIINTLYARDISKKSAAALRIKQENGEYIGSFAPYGYLKSPSDKHKLIVDEFAAPIVKQIFEWRAGELSYSAISRRLYDMKISPPNKHKYELGLVKNEAYKNNPFWRSETVKSILLNEVYIGNMAQGRLKSRFYDGKKDERINKENRIVVKNTHEPIVSEDLFYKAQEVCERVKENYNRRNGKSEKTDNAANLFPRKIKCGGCGGSLSGYKRGNNGKAAYFYICRHHSTYPDSCGFLSIGEDVLKTLAIRSIMVQAGCFVDFGKVLNDAKNLPFVRQRKRNITNEISDALAETARAKSARIRAVTDYSRNILKEEEYNSVIEALNDNLKKAALQYEIADKKRQELEKLFNPDKWICEIKKYNGKKKLSKDIADIFIENITVYPDKRIEITWSFGDNLNISGGERLAG